MKNIFSVLLLALGVIISTPTHAFLGAFWLGVDAKVETSIKVDQRALDTINNLPLEVRKQAVIAINETFDRLDQTIKNNSKLLGAEIERTSLQVSIQWECTAKNTIDKLFSEVRESLPRWKIFADRCEKKFSPDKRGAGPAEQVKIADCWIYDALPTSASPEVISLKMVTLQLMSVEAACRVRETAAATQMWKESAEYGLRYSTWLHLKSTCNNASECNVQRLAAIKELISRADSRDIGNAKERFEHSNSSVDGKNCDLICLQDSLIELHLAEQEIFRNRTSRENEGSIYANQAATYLATAKSSSLQAKILAASVSTINQYREQVQVAEFSLRLTGERAAIARKTSKSTDEKMVLVDTGMTEVSSILVEAARTANASTLAEAARLKKISDDADAAAAVAAVADAERRSRRHAGGRRHEVN